MRHVSPLRPAPKEVRPVTLTKPSLANPTRAQFSGSAFHHDFSQVPVHSRAPLIIQPKLRINTPGDEYELEAERISEQVMRTPGPPLQPSAANEYLGQQHGTSLYKSLQPKRVGTNNAGRSDVPPLVHDVVRSSGQPLDSSTRLFMEPRFGHDFSTVRVHTDARAAESASALRAQAYTVCNHIAFAAGQYRPQMKAGRQLLAHELTHTLQQRGSRHIQRKTPLEGDPASPSADLAEPAASEQAVPGSEPKALRVAEVEYDPQGEPLAQKLSAADKTRLIDLLAQLKKNDPAFYGSIENENLVVTRGKLPANNVGRHVLSVSQTPRTKSALYWFLIDHSGVDLAKGEPDINSEAWRKAIDLFAAEFPDAQTQNDLANKQEVRVIAGMFSSVLILDLAQIDARQEAYEIEYDKYRASSSFDKPKLPQSALATLRHEAGHLLFERAINYDKLGNQLPSSPLSATLLSQTKVHSADEDIRTDMQLLSEYAAEGTEQQRAGDPFDMARFAEENDPCFGVGGYHDPDGDVQAPVGFGVRMATGLTLIVAKQTARDLKAVPVEPVFLLTVPDPPKEQRRFDVLILMNPDKKSLQDGFDKLKTDFPALTKFKSRIVAY